MMNQFNYFAYHNNFLYFSFRENYFLINEKSTDTETKLTTLKYITHELIHQWLGDLMTPKSWEYRWIKESTTSYLQYYILNKVISILD